MSETYTEYLLDSKNFPNKYSLFPIHKKDVWDMYLTAMRFFWVATEIDLSKDQAEYEKLPAGEKRLIKKILAFFAISDNIVNENLARRFYTEVQMPEARAFYGLQIGIETIHAHTYSLLIDTYIRDEVEKDKIFRSLETSAGVRKKAQWAMKWMDSKESFAVRLLAFACVELVFFNGAFCIIFWYKSRGLLPGLAKSNDFISRDEGLHGEFACLLYNNYIKNKVARNVILDIVQGAIDAEETFIKEAFEENIAGINGKIMMEYIRYWGDRFLEMIGEKKFFITDIGIPTWMPQVSLKVRSDFFSDKETNYKKADSGAYKIVEDF